MDGKEIDSHYILAKEVIKKWTSNSDCYLLIEGVQHTLEVSTKGLIYMTVPRLIYGKIVFTQFCVPFYNQMNIATPGRCLKCVRMNPENHGSVHYA